MKRKILKLIMVIGIFLLFTSLALAAGSHNMKHVFDKLSMLCLFTISCTTIALTKGASIDDSTSVTHSADSGDFDFRIVRVPAQDHKTDKRPIFEYLEPYPRYVGKDRGEYYNTGENSTEPLGYIPEVKHSYAFFDAIFGIMNEHQLSIGECTCSAKTEFKPLAGKRIFYTDELTRVAMRRCIKAKDAVKLMGALAEEYGYYGPGETLTVADTNEIWVFEICSPPSGEGAIWVAKKVPDGEVFVAANHFRIREVLSDDPDMMYSKNLFKICEDIGWYEPKNGGLDWLETVSDGEPSHPYYSLRRVWRVYDLIAPSRNFKPWIEGPYTNEYPFSIKPDKKLAVKDLFRLHRDWYQGTEFDLTKDLTAGPFGNINRYKDSRTEVNVLWERAISIFRTSYVLVTQSRGDLPDPIGGLLWWGYNDPHANCFVPFYCGISDMSKSYQIGKQRELDRECAYWAYNYVSNLLDIKFNHMIKDVQKLQNEVENKQFEMQPYIEEMLVKMYQNDPKAAIEYMTKYCNDNADEAYKKWWQLADDLMVKYQDGYLYPQDKEAEILGYSDEWLKKINKRNSKYQKS